MSIEYKRISKEGAVIIPEEYRARVFGQKCWIFAAIDTEDHSWCGHLLLSVAEGVQGMIQLHELYVKPERREEGIGSELLEYAVRTVQQAGANRIYYKEITETEGAMWENASFCERNGFSMVVANADIDCFDLNSFDQGMIDRKISLYENLKFVRFQDEKDPLLVKWDKKNNGRMPSISASGADLKLSRFYIEDEEIKAAIFVKRERTFQAVVTGICIDENHTEVNKTLIRSLLVLYAIDGAIRSKCRKLYIMYDEETEKKTVSSLAGEPDGSAYATEWVREV